MKYGLFLMPSHPPERSLYDGHQFDLQVLRWADELGYDEAWIGEHHTCSWEPHPAPDFLIVQALLQTKRIRLGPGGFLLPFHHPAELANRVAMLDHMAQGRLNFGIAAGGFPTDFELFGVDDKANEHRERTKESLEIILKLWKEETFDYRGKYWHVSKPGPADPELRPHLAPLQKPHPPVGVTGLSPRSETLVIAGRNGFIPMSPEQNVSILRAQWETVDQAAREAGRVADRNEWRIVRDVFVADTDEEALRLAVDGPMGRMWREYYLELLRVTNYLQYLKHDESVRDDEITVEYCAQHLWLVGSPETVSRKLQMLYDAVDGFGGVLVMIYDHTDQPAVYQRSLQLFAERVMPRFRALSPAAAASVR